MDPVEVYCFSSEITKILDKKSFSSSKSGRKSVLSKADFMTICFLKHKYGIADNKALYGWIQDSKEFSSMFNQLPSYQQFNEGINKTMSYFAFAAVVLAEKNKMKKADFYIIDSTPLPICSNGHRFQCKMGKGIANSSCNMNGWWYGFKLHLIINDNMEIVSIQLSDAKTKDYNVLDGSFVKGLLGYLVGDKGYISHKIAKKLNEKYGIELVTRQRKNMKKTPSDKEKLKMLGKRQRIESVFSKLKYNLNMVTKKTRSLVGYMTNVFAAIFTLMISQKTSIEISQIYEILIS